MGASRVTSALSPGPDILLTLPTRSAENRIPSQPASSQAFSTPIAAMPVAFGPRAASSLSSNGRNVLAKPPPLLSPSLLIPVPYIRTPHRSSGTTDEAFSPPVPTPPPTPSTRSSPPPLSAPSPSMLFRRVRSVTPAILSSDSVAISPGLFFLRLPPPTLPPTTDEREDTSGSNSVTDEEKNPRNDDSDDEDGDRGSVLVVVVVIVPAPDQRGCRDPGAERREGKKSWRPTGPG